MVQAAHRICALVLGPDADFQLGKTKVFLKVEHQTVLEKVGWRLRQSHNYRSVLGAGEKAHSTCDHDPKDDACLDPAEAVRADARCSGDHPKALAGILSEAQIQTSQWVMHPSLRLQHSLSKSDEISKTRIQHLSLTNYFRSSLASYDCKQCCAHAVTSRTTII